MKSGYYRVEIQTDTGRMENGYYRVRYRIRDENGEKGITAGSLDDLKREIVNNRQLPWKIVDDKKAEKTRLLDAKIQEIKNQYIKNNENLDNIIDKAKVDKKILKETLREDLKKNLRVYTKDIENTTSLDE